MQIQNINSNSICSFNANIKSKKLDFTNKDFFVNIKGYGENKTWANETMKTADTAVNLVRTNTSPENVLRFITAGIIRANQFCKNKTKEIHTGILRADRPHWFSKSDWTGQDIQTNYSKIARYKHYEKRLNYIYNNPLTNPFKEIDLTRPTIDAINDESHLKHATYKKVNSSLNLIFQKYQDFFSKFNSKDINKSQLKEVNRNIAEIRWIMAHSTPWERGSDAISNVLMRVMYKAIGIKTYPLKKGISLDMEAYCTNLEDYKNNFTSYFESAPEIIE